MLRFLRWHFHHMFRCWVYTIRWRGFLRFSVDQTKQTCDTNNIHFIWSAIHLCLCFVAICVERYAIKWRIDTVCVSIAESWLYCLFDVPLPIKLRQLTKFGVKNERLKLIELHFISWIKRWLFVFFSSSSLAVDAIVLFLFSLNVTCRWSVLVFEIIILSLHKDSRPNETRGQL